MQKKKDKNLMKTDVKPMKQGLLSRIFHLYYDGFRTMTLGKTLWAVILHQACHHLPGAQALFLSRFYQYECQERRQGWLRFQGNSEQIRL